MRQTKNNFAYISRDYTCNVTQCTVASQRVRKKTKLNFNLVRFAKTSHFDNKEETLLNRLSLAEWQTQPWQNKSAWEDRHYPLEAPPTKQSDCPASIPDRVMEAPAGLDVIYSTLQMSIAPHRGRDALPLSGAWCQSWICVLPHPTAEVKLESNQMSQTGSSEGARDLLTQNNHLNLLH